MDRTTAARGPAGRYGREPGGPRRTLLVAVGVAAAVLLLGGLVWTALHWSTPEVRGGLVSYAVAEGEVRVQLLVVKDADATVRCRVRAQDVDNATVGTVEVDLAPPRHGERSTVTVVVPTSGPAVNGELVRCTVVTAAD